jgi:hypothetical protein
MDEERIKKAILTVVEKSLDAHELAEIVRAFARGPRPSLPDGIEPPKTGTQQLLTRIVLGDILDDAILGARPQDRTFPLRLFFGELGRLLGDDTDEHVAELAFSVASGLNFFFRSKMDPESKMHVGFEVSRQLYALSTAAGLSADLVSTATPLLAALMTSELERLRFETVDHLTVFDSSVHERSRDSDPTAANVKRTSSFLCRVAANNAVKIKAEVVT